jgi:integrase
MVRLTEAIVESLASDGRDRFVFDARQPGFAIRVTPTGTKIFTAQGYVNGRKRRITVGYYPNVSVAQARELALQALADMRRGNDPIIERKTRLTAAKAREMTLAQLADKWLADYVKPKLKPHTIRDYQQLLQQHILPALGQLSVAHIGRDDVVRLHVTMAEIPRRANYAISTIRALLNFAIEIGLRPAGSNPARGIKPYRENKRERFLTEAEIAKAADAITVAEQAGTIGPHGAAGLRLCLFTGARSGEVAAIEWSHIDWQRRLIRLPDSKTNEPRTIHLSEPALEVLKAIPRIGPYVIAGAKPNQAYGNLRRAWIFARGRVGLDDVRLHDLRHSYASLAASKGISLQTIGKLLGHRDPQTTARYSHLAIDAVAAVNDELGAAMQAAIAKGSPPPAKVVKLRRRRR